MTSGPDLVLAVLLDGERMVLQLDLDRDRYVALLEKLIGEVEFVQDKPSKIRKFVPQEDRYALITFNSLQTLPVACSDHAVHMQNICSATYTDTSMQPKSNW